MSSALTSEVEQLRERLKEFQQQNQGLQEQIEQGRQQIQQLHPIQDRLLAITEQLRNHQTPLTTSLEEFARMQSLRLPSEQLAVILRVAERLQTGNALSSQVDQFQQLQDKIRAWREQVARKRLLVQLAEQELLLEQQNLELAKANKQALQKVVQQAQS